LGPGRRPIPFSDRERASPSFSPNVSVRDNFSPNVGASVSVSAPVSIHAGRGQAQDQGHAQGGSGEGHHQAGDDQGLRDRITA
jgi:hypothetical protein